MEKFWESKKFWIVTIALIGIGVFVYLNSSKEEINNGSEIIEEENEEQEEDNIAPYSQIRRPPVNEWQNDDFYINVLDQDIGVGIKEGACYYKALSYSSDRKEEYSSGWKLRDCNGNQKITVGSEGDCRFEGIESCHVYVTSKDKNDNLYSSSKQEGSIKNYSIDFTSPVVSESKLESLGDNYRFTVKTSDNIKIIGCLLYTDGEKRGAMELLNSNCQNNCYLEKEFSVEGAGEHSVYAYCRDQAGNWGKGEELKIGLNTPPQINSCKVNPVSGTKETNFQFSINVNDINNDDLSFSWIFGDGKSSTEENPTHSYSKGGIYKPEVKVSDGEEEVSCSTVWVVIEE